MLIRNENLKKKMYDPAKIDTNFIEDILVMAIAKGNNQYLVGVFGVIYGKNILLQYQDEQIHLDDYAERVVTMLNGFSDKKYFGKIPKKIMIVGQQEGEIVNPNGYSIEVSVDVNVWENGEEKENKKILIKKGGDYRKTTVLLWLDADYNYSKLFIPKTITYDDLNESVKTMLYIFLKQYK